MTLARALSGIISGYFVVTSTFVMASNDQTIAVKRDKFLNDLDRKCAYTDGYQCHSSDPNFYSQEAQQSLVPAVYLPAWSVAYVAFLNLSELNAEQKELTHYKIGFAEEENHIVVLFSPLLLPYFDAKEPQGISTGTLGQSLKFWVDKKSLKVSRHIFLK